MSRWRPLAKTPWLIRWLPTWLHAPTIWLFRFAVACLVAVAGIGVFYFLKASSYDLSEVGKLPLENLYFDAAENQIETPGKSGRPLVERGEIPDFLVDALIAREDARFFEHRGVDFRGLARATLRNIKDRDFTQGASTLSMQLARNTFEMREKSLHRKAVEIALTLRMERHFTKDEILTHYLNRIYFGSGAYGIEQAANTYFGKTTSELNDGECALIAGIIRGPHIFSPLRNLNAAIEQRNQTLDRMVDAGLISEERRDEVKLSEIQLNRAAESNSLGGTSYAMKAVERELEEVMEEKNIISNGLHVYTTLDCGWQELLQTELNAALQKLEASGSWKYPTYAGFEAGGAVDYLQVAAVTTETKTGAVLAFIGGRDFKHSAYDRTHAKRDLGSAFEPFIFAAAAERGKLVFADQPIQTGRQIGVAEVIRLAQRCGLSGRFHENEDLFRGAVESSPAEMSVGLAVLGNEGKKPEPFFIKKITNRDGEVLYRSSIQTQPALSKVAANEAIASFQKISSSKCFLGSTSSERDAWVLRLGPSGSTAIWLGFDIPKRIGSEERLNALLREIATRLAN